MKLFFYMISLVQGSCRLVCRIFKPYNTLILTFYLLLTLQNINHYHLSFSYKIIMMHPSTRMLYDERRRGGVVHNDDSYKVTYLYIFRFIVYYIITCERDDTWNTFSSQRYRLFDMNCISPHALMQGQSDLFPSFLCARSFYIKYRVFLLLINYSSLHSQKKKKKRLFKFRKLNLRKKFKKLRFTESWLFLS